MDPVFFTLTLVHDITLLQRRYYRSMVLQNHESTLRPRQRDLCDIYLTKNLFRSKNSETYGILN